MLGSRQEVIDTEGVFLFEGDFSFTGSRPIAQTSCSVHNEAIWILILILLFVVVVVVFGGGEDFLTCPRATTGTLTRCGLPSCGWMPKPDALPRAEQAGSDGRCKVRGILRRVQRAHFLRNRRTGSGATSIAVRSRSQSRTGNSRVAAYVAAGHTGCAHW